MCQARIIKQPHLEIAMNIYPFLPDLKDQILPVQYRHTLGMLKKSRKTSRGAKPRMLANHGAVLPSAQPLQLAPQCSVLVGRPALGGLRQSSAVPCMSKQLSEILRKGSFCFPMQDAHFWVLHWQPQAGRDCCRPWAGPCSPHC